MLYLTSAEVNGSPLCNFTPGRSLNAPRGLPFELPLGGEPGVELAVGMAAGQVVEDVERDADVVGRGAEVRVELGDVARPARPPARASGWSGPTAAPPAGSGTVAAAPRAAAPLSKSRRVNVHVVAPPRCRAASGLRLDTAAGDEGARGATFIGVSLHPVKPGRRWRTRAKHDRIQRHERDSGHRHHRRRRERHEHRVSPGQHGREERPVLERRHLAAGATGKSGALVRMHYTNEHESRLAIESLRIFRDFAAIVGGDCGFEAPRLPPARARPATRRPCAATWPVSSDSA